MGQAMEEENLEFQHTHKAHTAPSQVSLAAPTSAFPEGSRKVPLLEKDSPGSPTLESQRLPMKPPQPKAAPRALPR